MPRIKSIIFDLDGVLVDAKEWHYDALNRALDLFGFRISVYDHVARYDGLPTRRKLQMLSEEHGFPESLHAFTNRLKQRYLVEIAAAKCSPNPIHIEALQRLRRDGLQLALASNSIRRTVDILTERTSLAPYLSFTLSNEDVSAAKPDPEIYIRAIKLLGLEPSECLVIEDGAYGIQAATAAAAHVLEVGTVHDVYYEAIRDRILALEGRPNARVA